MYTYNAKVVRVIDGDTVECDIDLGFHVNIRKSVRFDGIDTPEKNSRVLSEREKAAKATARTKYALENKTVFIKTRLDDNDKYGRVLGYIFETKNDLDNNQSFNDKLINEGLAYIYDGGKKNV
jgi:micrococcal nuclease